MFTPLTGTIAFGAIVLVGVASGVLVLVNAKRVHEWSEKHSPEGLRKPTLGAVRFLGGLWLFVGLFCVGGVVHWASQM